MSKLIKKLMGDFREFYEAKLTRTASNILFSETTKSMKLFSWSKRLKNVHFLKYSHR